MKKLLSIILVLMLALTLLTSCGNNEGQQPVSEGKEASGEGIFPAIAKEDIKVGVIHIGNPADGSGYSYAHDQGIVAMQKALGLSDSQVVQVIYRHSLFKIQSYQGISFRFVIY
jgi:basic membrane protein A